MKNNDSKIPWYMALVVFSSVPISQIVLYFSVSEFTDNGDLNKLQNSLNMNHYQLVVFQLLSILLYSLISFAFMYLIYRFLIKIFSKNGDSELLFFVLIMAILLSNAISILIALIFKTSVPHLSSIIQFLILTGGYYYYSNNKDRVGSIVLGVVSLIMNVLPSFL